MGCFTVLTCKKKKNDQIVFSKRTCHNQHVPTVLPEPQTRTRSQPPAPPTFRTRVKAIHPINLVTNRTRALSAPSAFDVEEDALSSFEYEDQEVLKYRVGSAKEWSSSSPQPLPLPSPQGGGALKSCGSFMIRTGSGPLRASRPVLDAVEHEYKEQEVSKHQGGSMKERCSWNPQPLPLPSHQGSSDALKASRSFEFGMAGGSLYASGPLPLPPAESFRSFPYEAIAAAGCKFSSDQCMSECHSSPIYKASSSDDASNLSKFEATVIRLHSSTQGTKEFMSDVNILSSLQHPNLCKLLGFLVPDGPESRMLVYERLCYGSLDRLLFQRSECPSIDWNSRLKIAICAAQGLTFLHEEGPLQAMYNEFSTADIQIDKDFTAKLSGYGCVGRIADEEISSISSGVGNLSVETIERGILTPKSNVWSFGIILLELLTGRRNIDSHHPREEKNLIKWSRPYLADDFRLSLIMDPKLKGRFPLKAARAVADTAQECLHKDPSERPTMRTIVEHLRMVQDMKYPCWFPLQEPATMSTKQTLSRSPSLNGITCHAPRLSFSPSPPSVGRPSLSPPRWSGVPVAVPTLLLPPHACSSTHPMEEVGRQGNRKSPSPVWKDIDSL